MRGKGVGILVSEKLVRVIAWGRSLLQDLVGPAGTFSIGDFLASIHAHSLARKIFFCVDIFQNH